MNTNKYINTLTTYLKKITTSDTKEGDFISHPPLIIELLINIFLILEVVWVCYTLFFYYDYWFIGLFSILFFIIKQLSTFVNKWSKKIGLYISNNILANPPFNKPLSKKKSLTKWVHQSWRFVTHLSMSLFALYIFASNNSYDDSSENIYGDNIPSIEYKYDTTINIFFLVQMVLWIYTAFSYKCESRKKDYLFMMIHHLVTILGISGSLFNNQLSACFQVLYIHDVTDIFVNLVKMFNYLKLENRAGYYINEILFIIMIIAWVYWRLYIYPFHILKTFFGLYSKWGGKSFWEYDTLYSSLFPASVPGWLPLNIVGWILLGLNIWWFLLFMKLLYGIFTKGAHETAKEEYEGDSDDEKND